MKRRILLVDDEVAVLLTLKAVLEISGFEVDTAASAREGRSKIHSQEYAMVITDMRMESEVAGREVIDAARKAPYRPAIALLTAFPVADEDWTELGADKLLLKPMHTRALLEQLEKLLVRHENKLALSGRLPMGAVVPPVASNGQRPAAKGTAEKAAAKKAAVKKPAKKAAKTGAKKAPAKKAAARR
jgi:DNA-binding response OmpR family regulator